jgi:hypothetical protein
MDFYNTGIQQKYISQFLEIYTIFYKCSDLKNPINTADLFKLGPPEPLAGGAQGPGSP